MPSDSLVIHLTADAHYQLEALRQDGEWMNRSDLREVVLDFTGVTMLNSMMVGHLVKLKLGLKSRHIALRLENLSPSARLVLYHSNLGELFGIALAPPRWEADNAL